MLQPAWKRLQATWKGEVLPTDRYFSLPSLPHLALPPFPCLPTLGWSISVISQPSTVTMASPGLAVMSVERRRKNLYDFWHVFCVFHLTPQFHAGPPSLTVSMTRLSPLSLLQGGITVS